ncbi:GntR family transcriptional regulator [Streptomyces abyssalis]|uniref:GntR family transcriptional regulator n=1 Tax=Streptomyces abyssalis TaxID=933944 RepID=A0A1E7JUX8_9ACTN|nr:GntR family transcriptional regulator [Streptomyces abyssalis]OEU89313.1 GntR family transcriptional regulator [Streptomyces abyssalis]OEU93714.1 GntR family transcriptional regulator [Streptomyces abyssalis]
MAEDRAGTPLVEAIREAIVRGEFVPNQRLVESDLSTQFDASRASVRAALLELTNEGLVERIQNRGARVRAVSLSEAVEISEVRMVLEGLCAAKAAVAVTGEEIRELQSIGASMCEAVAEGDLLGYSSLNQELHRRVREIGGQATASRLLERLRGQNVRHQFRLAMHPGRPSVSLPEHLAIIEAICTHDPEAADAAARGHLRSVIKALKEVDRSGAPPAR